MGLGRAYTLGPSAELVRVIPGKGERCRAGMRASPNLLNCSHTCWILKMLVVLLLVGFHRPTQINEYQM